MGDRKVFGVRGDDEVLLSIGELAERTGLPVKTIRHWSDAGVVPPAGRTAAGYRLFDVQAVARLELARTLRDLGLGLGDIGEIVDRGRDLAEVAAIHADALEVRIRTLRRQQAVLRSVARRQSTPEELSLMSKLARLSAAERNAMIRELVSDVVGDLDVPTYREGLLAATPDLPDNPTPEQIDAWIELGELLGDPGLRAAMRRMAEYAARHAPGLHDDEDLRAVEDVTEVWLGEVNAAMEAGIAADSASADPVVARIVAAWLPTQAVMDDTLDGDGAEPRRRLLEQLELAADTRVERYWQLMCVITGRPVRPSMAAAGRWLTTALRSNPEPGARAARVAGMADDDVTGTGPAAKLDACRRVLAEVERLVESVPLDRMEDPTPCAGWDVRALLGHLVWENLLWTSLAMGAPRSDFAADHLGDDHAGAFRAAARATLAAFSRPGMLEERFGPAPGWRLVEQVTIEMLVHGWDLAKALGRPAGIAPDVARAVLPAVVEIYGDHPRTSGASFAPARPVPPGATPADRLAAYLGRPVDWSPPQPS
ncbi:TIGR03086 family metal-binding protein [Sphaerisporangium sp. B11E5]|uniref:TIGR03086 family metal-binding protein n=1 Tax=Sphaerisporangium sp. B11E5 TaxID=3153563 RepID=UPI00325EABDD